MSGGQQQSHPRNADQQSGQVVQMWILVDQALDFDFQGVNMALQLEDSLFMQLFGHGRTHHLAFERFERVLMAGALHDELFAAGQQGLDLFQELGAGVPGYASRNRSAYSAS